MVCYFDQHNGCHMGRLPFKALEEKRRNEFEESLRIKKTGGDGLAEKKEKLEKIEELEQRMKQEKEIRGETWNPKPGDVLAGEVKARRTLTIREKKDSELIVIETKNGQLCTVWWSTVLKRLFDQVKVGDVVAIKYLREEKGKSGFLYKNYKWEIV